MKRSCMVIALVALLSSLTAPLFAQASTEGKEFWVALAISNAPNGKISNFEPFIAISAKEIPLFAGWNVITGMAANRGVPMHRPFFLPQRTAERSRSAV